MADGQTKIAILGGGMGALTAAFELTRPELAGRYAVTVYQEGWRLGGKGASGRDPARADRVEEHGLHIWMGFYENAFRLMRDCYAELGPGHPFRRLEDAFEPQDDVFLEERIDGAWRRWPVTFPRKGGEPGALGREMPTGWDYALEVVDFMVRAFEEWMRGSREAQARAAAAQQLAVAPELHPSLVERLRRLFSHLGADAARAAAEAALWPVEATALHAAQLLLERIARSPLALVADELEALLARLGEFIEWLWRAVGDGSDEGRRLVLLLDLSGAVVRGLLRDGLVGEDAAFERLDDLDLRDWLRRHGARPATLDSAPVRAVYELVFGQGLGIAAGSAMSGTLRMLFGYADAIFYKMRAGMGDCIFAPLYLVLARRGVRFRFFHRVTRIEPAADSDVVERVVLTRQARLVAERGAADPDAVEYQPLYPVRCALAPDGLPAWPNAPLVEQLEGGERFRETGARLDDALAASSVGERVLLRGRDFDEVVLGISIAGVERVAAPLLARSPRLADAVARIGTTATQAMQLWMKPELARLGWNWTVDADGAAPPAPVSPILGTYEDPWNDWSDMTQVLRAETWPARGTPTDETPRSVAYFCGRLDEPDPSATTPVPATGAPGEARDGAGAGDAIARVMAGARAWLPANLPHLLPDGAVGDLDALGEACVDPRGRRGAARLAAQYFAANVAGSDRYVLSLPGTTSARPLASESGFANLVFAGDWLRTGINGGCIEAATMGGMQASRAIAGVPSLIVGDPLGSAIVPGAPPPPRPEASPARPAAPAAAPRPGGYVERGGDIVLRQPFVLDDTHLFAFVLESRVDRLAALVDRQLNFAASPVVYRAVAPFVTLVAAHIGRGRSGAPADAAKGQIPETDIAFWVPVLATPRAGSLEAARLAWFLPYVWVDRPPTVAAGREIFGFPKQQAALAMPSDAAGEVAITVDADVLATYAPSTVAGPARIVEVRGPGGRVAGAPGLLRDALQAVHDVEGAVEDALLGAARRLFGRLGLDEVPLVFLKQFRDAERADEACYQAVVEADCRMGALRHAGLLPDVDAYRVTLARPASHPFVDELGLAPDGAPPDGPVVVTPVMAAYADFDFTLPPGRTIYRAR